MSDGANEVADAIRYLADSLRGDSPLAERSTIPDNLAELAVEFRALPKSLNRVADGLHRIAEEMEQARRLSGVVDYDRPAPRP